MTIHGQIGEFHGDPESWTSYVDQLECNFLANNVANAKKQGAILLSCSQLGESHGILCLKMLHGCLKIQV